MFVQWQPIPEDQPSQSALRPSQRSLPNSTTSQLKLRFKATAVRVDSNVYLIGGRQNNTVKKDAWKYSLSRGKWRLMPIVGSAHDKNSETGGGSSISNYVPLLESASAIVNPIDDSIWIFGGQFTRSADSSTSPMIVCDITTIDRNHGKPTLALKMRADVFGFEPKSRIINCPMNCYGHATATAASSEAGGQLDMYLYGGFHDFMGSSEQFWKLNLRNKIWENLTKGRDGTPGPRHYHTLNYMREALWLYGGNANCQFRGDFWRYTIETMRWEEIRTWSNPGPLYGHCTEVLRGWLFLFGGKKTDCLSNELWCFNADSTSWTKIALLNKQNSGTGTLPNPMAFHCMVLLPSEKDATISPSAEQKFAKQSQYQPQLIKRFPKLNFSNGIMNKMNRSTSQTILGYSRDNTTSFGTNGLHLTKSMDSVKQISSVPTGTNHYNRSNSSGEASIGSPIERYPVGMSVPSQEHLLHRSSYSSHKSLISPENSAFLEDESYYPPGYVMDASELQWTSPLVSSTRRSTPGNDEAIEMVTFAKKQDHSVTSMSAHENTKTVTTSPAPPTSISLPTPPPTHIRDGPLVAWTQQQQTKTTRIASPTPVQPLQNIQGPNVCSFLVIGGQQETGVPPSAASMSVWLCKVILSS